MKNGLNIIEVSIDDVVPNTWNPNVQSEFVFEKNKKSLEDEGQVLPIVVREKDGKYEIIDGEHRWRSAQALDWKTVFVNNRGEISDAKAKLLGQKLNRINGVDDKSKLKDLYISLIEEDDVDKDEILSQLPVLDHEFDELMKEVETDWAEMPSSPKENSNSESKSIEEGDDDWSEIKIRVPTPIKEQFDDQMERFKKLLYPNDEPADVSPVMPFEAMVQVIAQTPDEHVMGGEL